MLLSTSQAVSLAVAVVGLVMTFFILRSKDRAEASAKVEVTSG
jgi:hypothetical protein